MQELIKTVARVYHEQCIEVQLRTLDPETWKPINISTLEIIPHANQAK